jgi:putative MFS transporter
LEIGARLDQLPLTRLHLSILLIVGLGLLFDMMETTMSNVLATVFSPKGSGVSRQALMVLLVGFFLGGAVGAPLLGRLADWMGRKRTLILVFAGFGILTIATALSDSFVSLTILRSASGFMLAAGPPLVWITLADILPPASRGRAMMITAAGAAIGSPLSGLVSRAAGDLLPLGLDGWRWALILGGTAGLGLAMLLTTRPESPRWLAAKGRWDEAEAALARFEASADGRRIATPVPPTHQSPEERGDPAMGTALTRYVGRFWLLLVLQLLQTLGLVGIAVLNGAVMVSKGYDVKASLLFVGITSCGAPIGALLASTVVDRVSRRTLFVVLSITVAILGLAFGWAPVPAVLIGSGLLLHVLMTVHATALHIYGAEMFPTRLRGRAAGGAYGANRGGAALAPLTLLPLLGVLGPSAMFGAIAAALVAAGLLALLFGPKISAARALD